MLADEDGRTLASNDDSYITGRREAFSIRANLSNGTYYIVVLGHKEETGDYTLRAEAVTDPENTISSAARLNLDSPTPGKIDSAGGANYFILDVPRFMHLVIRGLNSNASLSNRGSVHGEVVDAYGDATTVNIYPLGLRTPDGTVRAGFGIWTTLKPELTTSR